jgi:hypothetical protein
MDSSMGGYHFFQTREGGGSVISVNPINNLLAFAYFNPKKIFLPPICFSCGGPGIGDSCV